MAQIYHHRRKKTGQRGAVNGQQIDDFDREEVGQSFFHKILILLKIITNKFKYTGKRQQKKTHVFHIYK